MKKKDQPGPAERLDRELRKQRLNRLSKASDSKTNLLTQLKRRIGELLNPALSREEVIEGLQELDELLNGEEEET